MGAISTISRDRQTALLLLMTMMYAWPAYCDNRLLSQWPVLMSHDAATGYLDSVSAFVSDSDLAAEKASSGPAIAYVQTQSGTLAAQLDCGVRSFDYRPYLDTRAELVAAHGGWVVHKKMEESIAEVVGWLKEHPSELVLLYLSHFGGAPECVTAVRDLLDSRNITFIQDCSMITTLTVDSARQMSHLLTGGSLLAIMDCVDENYDSSIACYSTSFTCYDSWPLGTAAEPLENLFRYINTTAATGSSGGKLWMTQAHWQYGIASVALGEAHLSSILLDEQRAGVNARLARLLSTPGALNHLNILEVDNACDGGQVLWAALQSWQP